MALGCGVRGTKAALIVFNLLFWISGILLLALGTWIFIDLTKAHLIALLTPPDSSKELIFYVAYVLLVLGSVILIAGILGCCGALQESRCLLITYFALLVLLLIGEFAVAAVTLSSRMKYLSGLQGRLLHQLSTSYGLHGANYSAFTEAMDLAQYKMDCCGVQAPEDYQRSRWWNDSSISNEPRNVPPTCCVLSNHEVTTAGSPLSVVSRVFGGTVEEAWQSPQPRDEAACQKGASSARHKQGCFQKLSMWFQAETLVLAGTSISCAVIQIFGMVLSMSLCNTLRGET